MLAAALATVAHLLGGLSGLFSPLILAVGLGILASNRFGVLHADVGMRFAASKLLRIGVVLIGLRVSLGDLAHVGLTGLAVVFVAVTVTFFGAQWLGRRMGVNRDLSLLIGTGFSICGASAVAAMNGVVGAEQEDVTYAIGLVTLAGSLSIAVLPVLGSVLGLTASDFGTWVGAAVHDVAQTVATASTAGDEALRAAIVVKLTRVGLLAPLVVGVAVSRRRRNPIPSGTRPPLIPIFVGGFLVMVLARTSGLFPGSWLEPVRRVEGFLFTVSLVGVGFGVSLGQLRKLGGKPMVLGMATWLLVAGMAYLGVVLTG